MYLSILINFTASRFNMFFFFWGSRLNVQVSWVTILPGDQCERWGHQAARLHTHLLIRCKQRKNIHVTEIGILQSRISECRNKNLLGAWRLNLKLNSILLFCRRLCFIYAKQHLSKLLYTCPAICYNESCMHTISASCHSSSSPTTTKIITWR